jgi:hypothetical protein
MINPLIRVIIDRLTRPVWTFFQSLRARRLRPPQPEFIHLIDPAPVPPAANGRRPQPSQRRAVNWQSRPRSH